MNNFIKTTLLVASVLLASLAANAYDFEADGIYYSINTGGYSVTVTTGGNGFRYSGTVNIPATVTNDGKQYNVTAIGYQAFYNCTELEAVTIGSKVKTIGQEAFQYCTALKAVAIPNSTEEMGSYTFSNCSNLKTVTIGTALKAIPSYAFASTAVTSITIPGNVETIGDNAFYGCSHLTSLMIKEGVVNINSGAFSGCSTLPSVVIPNTVKTVGYQAFYKCAELEELILGSNVKTIGSEAFDFCNDLKTITSCNEEAPVMGSVYCFSVYGTAKLYIPIGASASYAATNYWSKFTDITETNIINPSKPKVGDVTNDGEVNIADVNFIIDIILNGE